MKTIWKYGLGLEDEQTVTMPAGAEILSVQYQGDRLCLWAFVDSRGPSVQRKFRIFGTGFELPATTTSFHHIATVQNGPFVWHIFEG